MAKDYSKVQGVVAVGSSVFNEVSSVASSVAQDVVETGGSIWQSVIDTAADALASGKETVVDAGEAAYEALPEMEDVQDAAVAGVEAAGSVLPAIMDTAQAAGEGVMGSGLSEFKFLASNFFDAGGQFTEKDLNGSDLRVLRDVVAKAKAAGKSSVGYKDFGTDEGAVLKGGILAGVFDPELRMARTVGGFKFEEDSEGNTIIRNTYNFNEGPKRKKFVKARKGGNAEDALSILFSSGPVEVASILAYAKQEELKEEGKPYETEMVINLGKL